MKITFDNSQFKDFSNLTVANPHTSNITTSQTESAITVGKSVMQNNSYEGVLGKADIQSMMLSMDVKSTQDYMTVMAHSMSSEDFGEMMRSGERPMSVSAEDSVTILDTIKLAVAKGGTEIEGFTDTLRPEVIEAMTGSRSISTDMSVEEYDVTISPAEMSDVTDAYKKLSEITSMSEGMKKYFVANNEAFTIDNLYLAKHSVTDDTARQGSQYFYSEAPGYLAKKADEVSTDELKEEVGKLLEGIGYPVNEETVNNGMWLIENSLCITRENLNTLKTAESISFPISDMDFARITLAALAEGKTPGEALVTRKESVYSQAVHMTRVLEETRLLMTKEANLMLLKSDFSIDTADMEAYVEKLKRIESTPECREMVELSNTIETVERVKNHPAAIIGMAAGKIAEISLSELDTIGQKQIDFSMVEARYESVGTEVRKDLGDSIRKAFSNVDDILSDLKLSLTPENRRAVRILGYNSMPITEKSVNEVKEADAKVQAVISRLTPADSLKLIRMGNSPINMSIDELNEYLDSKEDVQKEEMEKYSKFLYKLEQNHEINAEERKQYIEVYRFFYNLEKYDMAAVGSVLNAGMDLTLGNLKTAIKTSKSTGMDIKVDSSYGMLVEDIREEMLVKPLVKADFTDASTLDALYGQLTEAEPDTEAEQLWTENNYHEMQEAMKAPAEIVDTLVNNNIPVSAENLEAAFMLVKQRGKAFSKAKEVGAEIETKTEKLVESFEDEDKAAKAYEDFSDAAKNALFEAAMQQETYLDVRALKLAHLQVSLAANLADSETYEIPVEIGDIETNVTLKIVHNSEEEPNVNIMLEAEDFGRVQARLFADGENISGFIACNFEETVTKMQKVADILGDGVKAVFTKKIDESAFLKVPMKDNSDEVSTDGLYKAAKLFLRALKGL